MPVVKKVGKAVKKGYAKVKRQGVTQAATRSSARRRRRSQEDEEKEKDDRLAKVIKAIRPRPAAMLAKGTKRPTAEGQAPGTGRCATG